MDEQCLADDTSGAAGGVVLVLDYPGRRAEAPVSSLGLESHGYTVHYLLKPPFPRLLTAASYAEGLLDGHGSSGGRVLAVLAYCMAAPIAQEVAASIRAAGGAPVPLVLFDGEPATARAIEEQYVLASEKLGELLGLTGEERTPPPAFDAALIRDEPEEALRRGHEGLLELGERAAAHGEAAVARAEAKAVADFYRDWLGHLIAAHNACWSHWGGPAVQIVSRDHSCAPDWPGATATRTVRVAASRNDLLVHPDVLSTVLSTLRKGSGHAI
ncbi:hypothetical protein [Microbispora sp. NPDC046933]|uniref:hypothetical protein n=1 Tax=Microbispora sp. NPDC046933 TaxID=3155618 RepID=UPI0033DC7940